MVSDYRKRMGRRFSQSGTGVGAVTLTGNAGVINLTNANNFLGTVGAVNSGSANALSITNAVGLTLGTVTSANAVTEINTTGNLSLTGAITATSTSLTSTAGTITESGGTVAGTLANNIGWRANLEWRE